MSDLKYISVPGAGEEHSDGGHYSQGVVIGNIVKLSGQGGWDNEDNLEQYDARQQIDNAFDNVDRLLRAAGLRGWEDVYSLRSYQTDVAAHWQLITEKLKQRIPGHRPLWTALGVPSLALPAMLVELEVEAIKQE